MRKTRLLWQLYPSYLIITVFSILVVAILASGELVHSSREFLRQSLDRQLFMTEAALRDSIRADDWQTAREHVNRIGERTGVRISIIRPDGDVVADSEASIDAMQKHHNRSEVAQALAGEIGESLRQSETLHREMAYRAMPVRDEEDAIVAVVRVALPTSIADKPLWTLTMRILFGAGITLVIAATLCSLLVRRINHPLYYIREGAERFARGELVRKLPPFEIDEIDALARAMNRMAVQLNKRIQTEVRERSEKDAVLASMVECVVAIDQEERIIHMNRSAGRMFDCAPENVQGDFLYEVVRNSDLQRIVQMILESHETIEGEVILRGVRERILQVHGSCLYDEEGSEIGGLVVINDITEIRRLENIRRDFVANVSHELRTPITSIKGFVETLLDDGAQDREQVEQFLKIVARHTDRLGAIIEDLLTLSRIQEDTGDEEIELENGGLLTVLNAAVQLCQVEIEKKRIEVEIDCAPELEWRLNMPLMEQAVVNLLNNAVKYSDEGGAIKLRAQQDGFELRIEVEDFGTGISSEHLSRIFERFYRVDKARSRKLGGTGLGLAIVKHIARAHGGRVEVESTLGRGSAFSIFLPA